MSLPALPSASPYQPATFQERGVALPFTTPLLGGARARLSRNRGIELILPNPAGGRGVYVMPLTSVTTLCRPTLYDKVVSNRIAFLETVSPATVRAIARATASEGLAGEGAMQAAKSAAKADDDDRRVVVYHLLSCLVRQVNAGANPTSSVPDAGSADLDARARQTIAWLAPRLGQSAGWGMRALDVLADAMTGIGVISGGEVGRIPRLIHRLGEMREGIADWAAAYRNGDHASFAYAVCSISEYTRSLAATIVTKVRMLTGDMVGLLRHWAADPETIIRVLARPEWLLDGWEQICLIWNYAQDHAARRVALVEIANYIPAMPRELHEWGGSKANIDDGFLEHGHIGLNEDWRTGATVFDLIARNEQLRAAAA